MQEALETVVNFIWKKVQCSNIRVELFHVKDEETGAIKVIPEVKNAFSKNGFKWKTLSNDPVTGKRA